MFTIQSLRSALGLVQDLHSRAVADGDDLMQDKWQAEIVRLTDEIRLAEARAS